MVAIHFTTTTHTHRTKFDGLQTDDRRLKSTGIHDVVILDCFGRRRHGE